MLLTQTPTGLTAMSTSIDTLSAQTLKVSCAAHLLNSTKRQEIGIHAIWVILQLRTLQIIMESAENSFTNKKKKLLQELPKHLARQLLMTTRSLIPYTLSQKNGFVRSFLVLIFICRALLFRCCR